MNKFCVMTELQRCVETWSNGRTKDIWFRGIYLGQIVHCQYGKSWMVFKESDACVTDCSVAPNYSSAIASFIPDAIRAFEKESLNNPITNINGFILVVPKKSLWQKFKDIFK